MTFFAPQKKSCAPRGELKEIGTGRVRVLRPLKALLVAIAGWARRGTLTWGQTAAWLPGGREEASRLGQYYGITRVVLWYY